MRSLLSLVLEEEEEDVDVRLGRLTKQPRRIEVGEL